MFLILAPFILLFLVSSLNPFDPCLSKKSQQNIVDNTNSTLQLLEFDLGYGPECFYFYIRPEISSMTNGTYTIQKVPDYNGLAAKFFNMGSQSVRLYWHPPGKGKASLIAYCDSFHTVGTASIVGHEFFFSSVDYDETAAPLSQYHKILCRFKIISDKNNYYYNPIYVPDNVEQTNKNMGQLTLKQQTIYDMMVRNQLFAQKYKSITDRDYLAFYPRRKPIHKMWNADYFGQEHFVTTSEVFFRKIPPIHDNVNDNVVTRVRDKNYREKKCYLNITLKVLSCAPRAFSIPNFLSDIEVNHIVSLATQSSLQRSTTAGGVDRGRSSHTRTSYNTWVDRNTDVVVDTIYRRAADVLRIDEKLLRNRRQDENPDLSSSLSIAESLQLVHYSLGQEYTPHHDFGYAPVNDPDQPVRFATLIIYLNEGMVGGETEFSRYINGETNKGLKVTPEKGKALLFYNQLPDGNYDDLSHHSANPVLEGEKIMVNLWVWDPMFSK